MKWTHKRHQKTQKIFDEWEAREKPANGLLGHYVYIHWTTMVVCWITCLPLHLYQIGCFQLEKWAQGCQNSAAHEMIHYAHTQWGRTCTIEIVRDLRTIYILALFEKDQEKNRIQYLLTAIFNVKRWKIWKRLNKMEFAVMMNPGTYVNQHV